jgi:hypothetical protein
VEAEASAIAAAAASMTSFGIYKKFLVSELFIHGCRTGGAGKGSGNPANEADRGSSELEHVPVISNFSRESPSEWLSSGRFRQARPSQPHVHLSSSAVSPGRRARRGSAADIVAARLRASRATLAKAAAVVACGLEDLIERMDQSGKVDAAWREVRVRQDDSAAGLSLSSRSPLPPP